MEAQLLRCTCVPVPRLGRPHLCTRKREVSSERERKRERQTEKQKCGGGGWREGETGKPKIKLNFTIIRFFVMYHLFRSMMDGIRKSSKTFFLIVFFFSKTSMNISTLHEYNLSVTISAKYQTNNLCFVVFSSICSSVSNILSTVCTCSNKV